MLAAPTRLLVDGYMSEQAQTLESIRQRLSERRHELLIRQDRVAADLARYQEPLTADAADRAIQTENDEPLQAIGDAAEREIRAIDHALQRLHAGQYGICKSCGGKIPDNRLTAVPYAITCAGCSDD
jgi:DnaK suppressor protein